MRIPRRVTSRELGDHGLLRVHGHDLDTGLRAITLDVPDWVLAVATNAAGQLVCVRQFRFGTESVTLEVAGGVLEPGENPAEAARRELYEETGHEGGEAVPLGWVHPNPALQANRAHLFLFEGAKHVGPPQNHEGEETEVVLLSRDEAREATRDGRITHVACSLAVERALARTDALATDGVEEVIRRGNAYLEAGATMIFVDGLDSVEVARRVVRDVDGPVAINAVEGGRTPRGFDFAQMQALGIARVSLPGTTLFAAVRAIRDVLAEVRNRGGIEGYEDRITHFADVQRLLGMQDLLALEDQLLGSLR